MEITVEYMRERLREFNLQRDEALGQLGACNGAIQLCSFLITELEKGGGDDVPSPKEQQEDG